MLAIDAESLTTPLLNHFGWLVLALTSIAGMVIGFRSYLSHARSLHLATLSSREKRSDEYNEVLRGLKESVEYSAKTQDKLVAGQADLTREMAGMSMAVKALVAKGGGKLSVADSQRIIEIELRNVRLSITRTLHRSLYRNHFKGNETTIRQKVMSKLTEIIDASVANLRHVNTSVDIGLVFSRIDDEVAGPYRLAVECWEAILPLYDEVIEKNDPLYLARQSAKLMNASARLREVFIRKLSRISRRIEDAYGEEADTHLDLQLILRQAEQEMVPLVDEDHQSDSYRAMQAVKGRK